MTSLCLVLLCLGTAGMSSAAGLQTHTNSIGMEFVLIPAGSFLLDTSESRQALLGQNPDNALPRRKARISQPFYLGKYEVTQAQWVAVMGNNPSRYILGKYQPDAAWFAAIDEEDLPEYIGPANPVEQVSWRDVQEFIRRLNSREGHHHYRLPTEMEWELAARGGTDTLFFFMKDPEKIWNEAVEPLNDYAWFNANSSQVTRHIGQKKPNPYGLYDIYGNVHKLHSQ
jgi:formylglycine-generating enzyme required for sulfatase activity